MADTRNALQRGAGMLGEVSEVKGEPQYLYHAYWVNTKPRARANSGLVIDRYSPVLEAQSWGYSGA